MLRNWMEHLSQIQEENPAEVHISGQTFVLCPWDCLSDGYQVLLRRTCAGDRKATPLRRHGGQLTVRRLSDLRSSASSPVTAHVPGGESQESNTSAEPFPCTLCYCWACVLPRGCVNVLRVKPSSACLTGHLNPTLLLLLAQHGGRTPQPRLFLKSDCVCVHTCVNFYMYMYAHTKHHSWAFVLARQRQRDARGNEGLLRFQRRNGFSPADSSSAMSLLTQVAPTLRHTRTQKCTA